jgi:hypothetical protein
LGGTVFSSTYFWVKCTSFFFTLLGFGWGALLFGVGRFFFVYAVKAGSTTRLNHPANGSKRRHQNRPVCQTTKKMKNKADAPFFY